MFTMSAHFRYLIGLLLATSLLMGCAHSYVDAEGKRHIVGLVNLTISPATAEPAAADWVRLRTIGISLSRSDISSSLDVGYSDNTLAVIRNNSCAVISTESFADLISTGENYASNRNK